MFLLDTNVVSELRRGEKSDPHVFGWASHHEQTEFFISAITILEIEIGASQRARNDQLQGHMLRRWIDETVLVAFDGKVLAVDTAIALRWASLHVAERDALIAATALVHGLTLATRNTRDFETTGAKLFNPWLAE